jgi:hypothetical protein
MKPRQTLSSEAAPVSPSSRCFAGTRLHGGASAPEEGGWKRLDDVVNETLVPVLAAHAAGTAKRRALFSISFSPFRIVPTDSGDTQ